MLSMHFVEHHLDVLPLSDFVKAVFWVRVHTTAGALVAENGKERTENTLANHFRSAVVAVAFPAAKSGCNSRRGSNGFLNKTDA